MNENEIREYANIFGFDAEKEIARKRNKKIEWTPEEKKILKNWNFNSVIAEIKKTAMPKISDADIDGAFFDIIEKYVNKKHDLKSAINEFDKKVILPTGKKGELILALAAERFTPNYKYKE